MNDPLLSVIVPVYKSERYLDRCVDSVLGQSFSDFELILVDDGSPDNSGAICDKYALKDNRVRVIHQQNAGSSAARNAGLGAAKGEFIYFVDSDDYIDQGLFAAALEAIDGYDLLTLNYRMVDDCGNEEDWRFNDTNIVFKNDNERFCFLAGAFFDFRIGFSPWLHFYRKDIIDRNRLHFEDGVIIAEDLCFNFCYLMYAETITFLPDVYYNYMQHSDSVMGVQSTVFNFGRMNALSKALKNNIFSQNGLEIFKECYPIIHIQLMNNVLNRAKNNNLKLGTSEIRRIMQEDISDWNYFKNECLEVKKHLPMLSRIIGRLMAQKMYYEFKYYADGKDSALNALKTAEWIIDNRRRAGIAALKIRDRIR